ncbi:MAG: GTPase [Verrucomicrobiota bacterium]|jgi:uncharacterized protein (DUF697 family)
MNRSLLLHVVERLETVVGKLPATIQKPILHELTPLKELFLQQRAPRFLITGSSKASTATILAQLFSAAVVNPSRADAIEGGLWRDFDLADRGTISVLDARDEADVAPAMAIERELEKEPADIIFFFEDDDRRRIRKGLVENVVTVVGWNDQSNPQTPVLGVVFAQLPAADGRGSGSEDNAAARASRLQSDLASAIESSGRFVRTFTVRTSSEFESDTQPIISLVAKYLPNDARIEMARISGDRETQSEIAQLLVKSTTAICTAIGAQPIPLADLPILTTLQLVMVSGIMYLSGRERSLRAATEFVAALGANVGAGMLLREGTRAILKFFPGWGNLVCGMVAGAGTYAIGRAAIAYFLEGVSLKDARRTYLASRRKRARPALMGQRRLRIEPPESRPPRRKGPRLRR